MNINSGGFTLVELIVVVSLFGILVTISIPNLTSYIKEAEARLFQINCKYAQKMYDSYLETHGFVHNDTMFYQFSEDYLLKGVDSGNNKLFRW